MASLELKMSVGEAATATGVEPPRKRQKLSPTPNPNTTITTTTTTDDNKPTMDHRPSKLDVVGETSDGKEAEVGILHFVNASNPGFSGVLKQRYVNAAFYSASDLSMGGILLVSASLVCFSVQGIKKQGLGWLRLCHVMMFTSSSLHVLRE